MPTFGLGHLRGLAEVQRLAGLLGGAEMLLRGFACKYFYFHSKICVSSKITLIRDFVQDAMS